MLSVCITVLGLAILLFIWWLLEADRPGTVHNVQVNIGPSERFAQTEIESAADIVKVSFPSFVNSELAYLWYDEAPSVLAIERSHLALDQDSTIILFSTIVVREPGGPGFLAPGTLENLGWVLVRDLQSGEWELIAAGFEGLHF